MASKGLRGERDAGTPIGFLPLTVSTVAVGLTNIPNMATFAFIEVQAAPIMVRFDGPDPTATIGHIYNPGQTDVWNEREMRAAKAIRQVGVDGTLVVTYYKS
jgi:hypothetical protein